MSVSRACAAAWLALVAVVTLLAPLLAPRDPHRQHSSFPSAPPVRPRVIDREGRWRLPFVYPVRLADRLEGRYTEDRSVTMPISAAWDDDSRQVPVFLLGTDALGRDLLSRLLFGARTSMGIAVAAAAGALVIGVFVGAVAGYRQGAIVDEVSMRVAEMILVLPALYIVLALRAAMPLVMEPRHMFGVVAAALSLLGWPFVARGVRSIMASERRLEYVEAARACGASAPRIVIRHMLPATFLFVATQAALLVPAFTIAEATLSYAGFGFAEPTPSWGTMLQEAGNVRAFADRPWLLAPAVTLAAVSCAMHALVGTERVDGAPATPPTLPYLRVRGLKLPDRVQRT